MDFNKASFKDFENIPGMDTYRSRRTKDLVKFGNRIKALRFQSGYSNYEYFAYDHEISRAQYGRYERGEGLRYTSLLKLIRALGVIAEEFFSEGFD